MQKRKVLNKDKIVYYKHMSKKIVKKKETNLLAKEFQEFLNSHNVSVTVQMSFPEYKILPVDVQLALKVLSKHNSNYVLNFVEKDKNGHEK